VSFLVEAIMHLHKTKQEPINGIFLSPSLLEGAKGRYLAFDGNMGSDHQGIWLDIQVFELFDDTLQQYTPMKAR